MKKIVCMAFMTSILGMSTSVGQTLAPKDGTVQLPSVTALKVDKVLYQFESKPHHMGDGHRAYVAQIDPDALTQFVKTNVSIDTDWSHGSMQKYKLYLEILDWIMKAPEMQENADAFGKVADLAELRKTQDIYIRATYKRNGDGFLTDATLWIIHPNKYLVIMLNENT